MKIDVITIFPELFSSFLSCSIVARVCKRNLLNISVHDLRDYSEDRHRSVDDTPYGGGPGMVMKPEPWFSVLEELTSDQGLASSVKELIMLSPKGETLTQKIVEKLSKEEHLILVCGRYEDIDDRVRQHWRPRELSLGDYIINGGELASQVLIESVIRLLPGALGDPDSAKQDSFSDGLLDHRHFTKPRIYKNLEVPEVLVNGNHEIIRQWRLKDALRLTHERRPDLLENRKLTEEEKSLLKKIVEESNNEDNIEKYGEQENGKN